MRKYLAIFTIAMLALLGSSTQAQDLPQVSTTAVPVSTQTVSTNGFGMTNAKYRGIELVLNVSAVSGTNPTLDAKLQWQDPVSLTWVDLSGAVFQRITTTGQRTLTVYPAPEGRGNIRSIAGTNPAAGAEILETVPVNTRWKLVMFRALLVTSATVNARNPIFTLDDGVSQVWTGSPSVTQAASTTVRYMFAPSYGAPSSLATHAHVPAPDDTMLPGGYRIGTVTTLLDAADDWSAPQYVVEEFIGNYTAIPLPREWRVVTTIGGTTPSFTFSVAGFYMQ